MYSTGKHQPHESKLLLSSFSHNETSRKSGNKCRQVGFCLTSKAAILVLTWTVFVGTFHFIMHISMIIIIYLSDLIYINVALPFFVLNFFVMLLFIFYPLCGYFADVWCGRFRTIITSLTMLLFSTTIYLGCLLPSCLLSFKVLLNNDIIILLYSLVVIFLFISIIGVAGFGANFIQFGLDQLLEAPSHHQALFVHWAKWCYDLTNMGSWFLICIALLYYYDITYYRAEAIFISSSYTLLGFVLLSLLLFGYWKRHWFNSEPAGHNNPYKIVVKVLHFAWNHTQMLQRSAFTYCDDERPSRLDFAKERYGGPFTTEQVEDVKTLLKVVVILSAIGPIFMLDTPTSTISLAVINSHLVKSIDHISWSWVIVTSGLLRHVTSTVFLPIYIWIVFVLFRKRTPKIFYRLGFGIFSYLLGVLVIFTIDVIGHIQHQGNGTKCIYIVPSNFSNYYDISYLEMHWAVNIPSNMLIGIGSTTVTVTIFEFISAQSPYSMKGLLLGTHFAITGVYQFLSSVLLVPFTLHRPESGGLHPPPIGCMFGYFLLLCLIAFADLILFSAAAKWYQYRERDDRPYDHRFVIDVYSRYLSQAQDYASSESDGD